MNQCKVSVVLAYIAFIYILASVIYLIASRSYGTPFKDAVSKYPELVEIKRESVNKRMVLFLRGIIFSLIILLIARPFKSCK